jgi:hypothetical protein
MSLINSDVIPASATAGYTIDQSLRFNDDDNPYLTWTPSSAGNTKTWTFSCWFKRGKVTGDLALLQAHTGSAYTEIKIDGNQVLNIDQYTGSAYTFQFITSAKYRDVSAWYHLVVKVDTTDATSSNRVKVYINGEQVTAFSTETYPSQNATTYLNDTYAIYLGSNYNQGEDWDGYLSEINFIDGQALDPTSFGETGDYGEWKPKKYTGSYGTNGFYLDFDGTYYNDKSGNGNHFTASNLATTDVVLDSPTNNFATFNPIHDDGNIDSNFYEGNLKFMNPSTNSVTPITATMGAKTGKWYAEFYNVMGDGGWGNEVGVIPTNFEYQSLVDINYQGGVEIRFTSSDMDIYNNTSQTQSNIGSASNGDVFGIALDLDGGTVQFYQNGSTIGSSESLPSTTDSTRSNGYWTFAVLDYVTSNGKIANFGQDSSFAGNKTAQGNTDGNNIGDFYYTPPSGYLALCTANLPDPAVIPSEHFNTVLWTGDGTSGRSITGVGFQPDWVWFKCRSVGEGHQIYDAVRGASKVLYPDYTSAEQSRAGLTSFNSDGFTVGSFGEVNGSGRTYVGWNWKGFNGTSSNTNGSITSTVSANQDSGFSIVSYSGASNATSDTSNNGGSYWTIGHGLSQAPEIIIVKKRSAASWYVGSDYLGTTPWADGKHLTLDTTAAVANESPDGIMWGNTAPTSSVFTVGGWDVVNRNGSTYIAYAFHSVDGFSKVGSYTGNGSTDGTFVYTGFRPAWIMYRNTELSENWAIHDTKRDIDNLVHHRLDADRSNAEDSTISSTHPNIDIVSNGFKHRAGGDISNASGRNYIYIAFAENPFKHTNAR